MLTGHTKRNFAPTSLVAKTLALRDAISLAVNLNMEAIVLESDYLEAIQSCRGETRIGKISNIIQYDIWNLRSKFQRSGFTWVAREGNDTTHHTAQLAHSGRLPLHWTRQRPTSLQIILNQELHLQPHACPNQNLVPRDPRRSTCTYDDPSPNRVSLHLRLALDVVNHKTANGEPSIDPTPEHPSQTPTECVPRDPLSVGISVVQPNSVD